MSDKPEDLTTWRQRIDDIDKQILDLLNERARCNAAVGRLKASTNAAVFVPGREIQIFERLERLSDGPFPLAGVRNVFREILSASRSLQKGLRVAYLGPLGTYTHQAALQQFGQLASFSAEATMEAIFDAVRDGAADFGVVPIENSTEGVVTRTLDLFVDSPLTIVAEIMLPVHHALVGQMASLEPIAEVHSHPQALAQCRRWLDSNLPGVPMQSTPSTAVAAEAAQRAPHIAAIASEMAAEVYDLNVVRTRIEDERNNVTRFLVVSTQPPQRSHCDVTSILFSIQRDQSGALQRALAPFAKHGVNLTRIESRPTRVHAWEYIFFCDFEGHREDEAVSRAIAELRPVCDFLKVLGSYPRAARGGSDGAG